MSNGRMIVSDGLERAWMTTAQPILRCYPHFTWRDWI